MERARDNVLLTLMVTLSALVHLFAFYSFPIFEAGAASKPLKDKKVNVVFIPRDQLPELPPLNHDPTEPDQEKMTAAKETPPAVTAIPAPPPLPAPPQTPPPKPEEKPELLANPQIVDLGPENPNDMTPPPKKAHYVAERNLQTERETVKESHSRTGAPYRPAAPPAAVFSPEESRSSPPPAVKPNPAASSKPRPARPAHEPAVKKAGAQKKSQTPPQPEGKVIGTGQPPEEKPTEVASRGDSRPGEPGLRGDHRPGDGSLRGRESPGDLDRNRAASPGSNHLQVSMADIQKGMEHDNGSVDYLPYTPKGDVTSLNAQKYAYAEFYNRVKKVIRFYWSPEPALRMINWTGSTLETRLRVVVESDGKLSSVEVAKSCGYPVVDAAAVAAVRKAAPFFNVPPALLNEQGKLEDVWSFYIHS